MPLRGRLCSREAPDTLLYVRPPTTIHAPHMMGDPSVHEIVHGERGMLRGIDACIEALCLVSAVTLIYSAIDALAGLTVPTNRASGAGPDFKAWAEKYFVPYLHTSLSSADLWAARCGVLHAYSRHSDLSRQGQARSLVYRWRHVHHPNDLLLQQHVNDGAVVVEIEALADALRHAVQRFQEDIERNPNLRARVQHHVAALLCYKPSMPAVRLPRAHRGPRAA